ncbi:hypothetical protein [Dapis sp. BLCC M229]|uniref:hypothetical protein n=1 Tax=Dapis sp. BLCC M229 TaxID=3400188 RepID=UPI003CF97EC2
MAEKLGKNLLSFPWRKNLCVLNYLFVKSQSPFAIPEVNFILKLLANSQKK